MKPTNKTEIASEVKETEIKKKNEEACLPTLEKQVIDLEKEVSLLKLEEHEDKVSSSKLESGPISKEIIRNEIWGKCSEECRFKIPLFEGEFKAVERLINLDAFKCAKVIATTTDRTLERVRREAIKARKVIIVATPGLNGPGFRQLKPPAQPYHRNVKFAASTYGMKRLSQPLEVTSDSQIDLVILGSVAVDEMGNRIGKGKGFSDLEIAVLSEMGLITNKSIIGTIVDDFQVYNMFQGNIFESHDVLLDLIVTPTRTIFVRNLIRPTLMRDLLPKTIEKKWVFKQLAKEEKKGNLRREIRFCGKPLKPKFFQKSQQG